MAYSEHGQFYLKRGFSWDNVGDRDFNNKVNAAGAADLPQVKSIKAIDEAFKSGQKAWDDRLRGIADMRKGWDVMDEAINKFNEDMDTQAESITKATDPLVKYQDELQNLESKLSFDKISQNTFDKAAENLRDSAVKEMTAGISSGPKFGLTSSADRYSKEASNLIGQGMMQGINDDPKYRAQLEANRKLDRITIAVEKQANKDNAGLQLEVAAAPP